jgi:hypothetical protein
MSFAWAAGYGLLAFCSPRLFQGGGSKLCPLQRRARKRGLASRRAIVRIGHVQRSAPSSNTCLRSAIRESASPPSHKTGLANDDAAHGLSSRQLRDRRRSRPMHPCRRGTTGQRCQFPTALLACLLACLPCVRASCTARNRKLKKDWGLRDCDVPLNLLLIWEIRSVG